MRLAYGIVLASVLGAPAMAQDVVIKPGEPGRAAEAQHEAHQAARDAHQDMNDARHEERKAARDANREERDQNLTVKVRP